MKKFILILLSIHQLWICNAQSDKEFFVKGNECQVKKDYKCSIEQYTKAIDKNNHNEDYFYQRGLVYSKLEKNQKAYEDFCLGIKINSFSAKLYLERANLYKASKMNDEALDDYLMAINYAKVDSIKQKAYKYRAFLKYDKFDYQGTYDDLLLAYKLDTNDLEVMVIMSSSSGWLGKKEETLNLLYKILSKDSLYPTANMNLAMELSLLEKYKEAEPYFDKCVQLAPQMAYNYSNRSYNKLKLNDIAGALKDVNYSIKLDPSNSWAYKNRGLIYLAQGKKEKACEEFNKAIELGYTKQYDNDVNEFLKANNCEVIRK